MADITGMLQAAAGGGNPNAWDISKAVYDAGTGAWDIAGANQAVDTGVGGEETVPRGVFFKPDGTKMYIVGTGGDEVNEYTLSAPWVVTSKTFVQNFSVATEDTAPVGLFFKPDGTKMYVLGDTGDDVNEYSLSTAWNISTASYVQNFSVSTEETTPTDLFFKPDGTKMYVLGDSGNDVNEYTLSTAWNISTASYVQNFSVNTQDSSPRGLFFKFDGTVMYVTGNTGGRINQYSLSTAWDISSASFSKFIDVIVNPSGLFFKPDGSGFFVIKIDTDTVYSYAIGGFDVNAQESNVTGIFFKPDGTKMYIVGSGGDEVNEYSLSTAWNVYSATFVQNFSIATEETAPTDLFFKPDGTKMYICGTSGDDVNEYSLSTPWDISTASYVQNFSVATEETSPEGLFFKPDGTKMYVCGNTGDDVNEYSLSTAWNISTASYVQNFSVASQETAPRGVSFKPDGTKMYVVGSVSGYLNEYSLSAPWNISTASYVQNFSVQGQSPIPSGVFFKEDGDQFFISDPDANKIFPYTIE